MRDWCFAVANVISFNDMTKFKGRKSAKETI